MDLYQRILAQREQTVMRLTQKMTTNSLTRMAQFLGLEPRYQWAWVLCRLIEEDNEDLLKEAKQEMFCLGGGCDISEDECRFCPDMLNYIISMYGEEL